LRLGCAPQPLADQGCLKVVALELIGTKRAPFIGSRVARGDSVGEALKSSPVRGCASIDQFARGF
jgi:hypothetical protein